MNEAFMRERPVLPLIVTMSLPMVLSMLVNSLYHIVDSFFVAQISEASMTALSLVYPIQNLVNALAIGFGVGLNAAISFYLGSERRSRPSRAPRIHTWSPSSCLILPTKIKKNTKVNSRE